MKTRLTKSEMEIMEVLWDEGKALTHQKSFKGQKKRKRNGKTVLSICL